MAYAAVISLKLTINRHKNHIKIPRITKSAYQELNSLDSTLKKLDAKRGISSIDRSAIHELDAKIRDAVWKLEDVIESHVLEGLLDKIGVEQETDSFLQKVKSLREEYSRVLLHKPLSLQEDEAAVSPIRKSTTVGFSDLSDKITNELLDGSSGLKFVSLVGMAGIGKTHLATQIYHQLTDQHFDVRAWVRIGPNDQLNNMLVDLVAQIEGKPRDLFKGKSKSALQELLQNSLRGRRYLIVLDDVWSKRALDYFTGLLPNASGRVLLTTRLQEVVQYRNGCTLHRIPFLNNEESWELLWRNVFVDEESFPSKLEKAGRKIAEKCEGLPLLIHTVADILRGDDKTEEYWDMVAEMKTSTFTDAYDQIYEVLLTSYQYLPQYLKPFFLYMGVFPQGCEIPFPRLIDLLSVEDFLEPALHFATDCVADLVSKSLVIVCKECSTRRRVIKSCKLHCAYWYLCVKEAKKNEFLHVLNKLTDVPMESQRRLSVQNNILLGLKEVHETMYEATLMTRSLLCTGEYHPYPVEICFNMMLLKVLDALAIRFYEFPIEVLKLLELRYLTLTHNGELPRSISKLQHLQCLILRRHHNVIKLSDSTCLPKEIWEMRELRHLRIMGNNLPNPSKGATLSKLSRLYLNADSCTEAVFRSIPNDMKKLGIKIELQPGDDAQTLQCLEHVGILNTLESLNCVVVNQRSGVLAPPEHLSKLPWGLMKLSLNGLGYSWEFIGAIGSLPHLQVLKLRCSAFQGPHWETEAGQFKNLGYLLLEDIDLVNWTTQCTQNNESFRFLRHLIIRHCYKLKNIPSEIGDLRNLKTMEVEDCSPTVVASALQIKEKRSSLQLVINSSWTLR